MKRTALCCKAQAKQLIDHMLVGRLGPFETVSYMRGWEA